MSSAGAADFAHLIQGEHTENQHQAANQGETGERPWGDIHIAKGHGADTEKGRIHAG